MTGLSCAFAVAEGKKRWAMHTAGARGTSADGGERGVIRGQGGVWGLRLCQAETRPRCRIKGAVIYYRKSSSLQGRPVLR